MASLLISHDGEIKRAVDWRKQYGISFALFWFRIHRNGWSIEDAATIPPHGRPRAPNRGFVQHWPLVEVTDDGEVIYHWEWSAPLPDITDKKLLQADDDTIAKYIVECGKLVQSPSKVLARVARMKDSQQYEDCTRVLLKQRAHV